MKKAIVLAAAVFVTCALYTACNTQPDTQKDSLNYASLQGTWIAKEDSSFSLALDDICCGSHSYVSGRLRSNGTEWTVASGSALVRYTVIKPDSSIVYVFEMNIVLPQDTAEGGVCGMDGFMLDSAGDKEWPDSVLHSPATLSAETRWVQKSACVDSKTSLNLVKKP